MIPKRWWTPLEALVYPPKCGICGLLSDLPICQVCEADFQKSDLTLADPERKGSLDAVARLYRYEGRAEQAVRRLKYGRATILATPMAAQLAAFAETLRFDETNLFVPVPIHWSRRYLRGFNQSELLSEALPNVDRHVLLRRRATRQQVGLSPEERRHNLDGAFECRKKLDGASVVLVDDVITTGYTVEECARVLKNAGALNVVAIAFAGG